ncbi:hypothetical protein EGW08_016973 [Elysia chlorotica]|uniref:Uncharacterized protein n=1 Tax=Elysia chlorotica TaxID=188477 RepID=A0A3S1B9F4_ELYCH|nr:hypothetical protein EGW08_016973 [Elysia chlorotica]
MNQFHTPPALVTGAVDHGYSIHVVFRTAELPSKRPTLSNGCSISVSNRAPTLYHLSQFAPSPAAVLFITGATSIQCFEPRTNALSFEAVCHFSCNAFIQHFEPRTNALPLEPVCTLSCSGAVHYWCSIHFSVSNRGPTLYHWSQFALFPAAVLLITGAAYIQRFEPRTNALPLEPVCPLSYSGTVHYCGAVHYWCSIHFSVSNRAPTLYHLSQFALFPAAVLFITVAKSIQCSKPRNQRSTTGASLPYSLQRCCSLLVQRTSSVSNRGPTLYHLSQFASSPAAVPFITGAAYIQRFEPRTNALPLEPVCPLSCSGAVYY